jgi:hypothetical protein
MPHSTEQRLRMRRPGRLTCVLLGATLLCSSASAEDGTLRVRESALNEFAAAVQPLTITRTWSFTLWLLVPNPFLFGIPTPVPVPFSCLATASVTGLVFDIAPGSATVRGNVNGTVCGIGYQSTLSTAIAISLDPAGAALVIRPGALGLTPTVTFQGYSIRAPFSIDVAPALTVASIPLEAALLEIETPTGARRLVLNGRNLQLSRHDGYLEIKGDALFR